jgi:hypothetical protein
MEHDGYKGHGKTLVLLAVTFFLGGIAVQWGWNSFAVDVLSQTPMQFKHAIAAELLLLAAAGCFHVAGRVGKARQ